MYELSMTASSLWTLLRILGKNPRGENWTYLAGD
jgi:hypothetical protein